MTAPIENVKKAIVAVSGGVDSAVALGFAVESLGVSNVIAVTATNSHIFRYQIERARMLASRLGVAWEGIKVPDMPPLDGRRHDRCYTCKRAVMSHLLGLARRMGFDAVIDGSTADDDPAERPGMAALEELGIKSPLRDAGLRDDDIRACAERMYPGVAFVSESCIATRVEDDVATKEVMGKIERVEDHLRGAFPGIRVKVHSDGVRVEFRLPAVIDEAAEARIRDAVADEFPGAAATITPPNRRAG